MSDVRVALEQRDVWQPFERAGERAWTVLYKYWEGEDERGLRLCVLAPKRLRPELLSDDCRLPSLDLGAPGFVESRRNGRRRVKYLKYGDDRGFEPLVIVQDHYRARPAMLPQLSEEFRLYHNLWANKDGTQFVKVNDDGSEELAAEIGPDLVKVRTKYVRQFQAGKQLDLVMRVNSIRYVGDPREGATLGEVAPPIGRDDMSLSIYVSAEARGRQMPSSYLSGRKLLTAPSRTRAGMPPFNDKETAFHDFIIGEDADGEPVEHSCDPRQLNNNFGANPGTPHYFQPVYFRREVLQRYYESPEKFSIEDGRLSCAGLWGLQIDNDHPDHVMVFLGDLGRDLPESERPYWQTFNVVPTGRPSRTVMKRSFLALPTDPEAPDLRFKSAYGRFNAKWHERFGWALFKQPEPDDAHILQRLRIPLNDSQPEFEDQVMGLAKVSVDALNERALQEQLPAKAKDEKGISKLERWMLQEQYPSVDRDIAFLRRLQRLRSKLTAHRKGSDYAQVLADEDVNPDPIQEVASMLRDAERLLYDLAAHAGIDLESY